MVFRAGRRAGAGRRPAGAICAGAGRSLSRLPFAAVDLGSVYYTLWLLFAYAVFCLCLFRRGEKGRLWLGPVAVVVVLCAAVAFSRLTVTAPGLTVAVLDVGQGQSVVLCSSRYAAVVDCGGNAAENAGDSAADYLQNLGRSHLDLLVLTHFHDDHANGVAQLMARMTGQTVAMPPPADERGKRIELLAGRAGAEIRYITQPQHLALGGAVVTLYPPLGGEGENENGLAMLCSAGEFDVLITGDMGAELESRLVRYRELPDIELFVAGHHGSKYSSSDTLLRAVTPELAVISTGRNSYGHPAPETLERLAGYGIEIYRTTCRAP
jgi:competence protein ComEC